MVRALGSAPRSATPSFETWDKPPSCSELPWSVKWGNNTRPVGLLCGVGKTTYETRSTEPGEHQPPVQV